MTNRYQNIVIGGGHNGLVCAAYLARAGRSVLVLEAADQVGGAARTRELAPGAKVSSGAHLLHAMPAELIRDLELAQHGLLLAETNLATVALSENGSPIEFVGNTVAGAAVSAEDVAAFALFNEHMQRFAKALRPVFEKLAPEVSIESWGQRLELLGLGWTLRKLGRDRMREFLRIIGMNFYDLLDEYFQNPQLKAAIAMDALLGSEWGARSMGSVLTYLYRLAGYQRSDGMGLALPVGGMGALSQALATSATASGAEIRVAARVRRIVIEDDKAVGVELESGERIETQCVISNADPKTTFLQLVDIDHLDTGFVRRIKNLRSKGRAGKLHLVLNGAPTFKGSDTVKPGARLLIAPTMDDIELAFNPCKYQKYPTHPVMEIVIPSASDKTLCADGQHVLSAVVQYLPYDNSPDEDTNRSAFLDVVLTQLERYAPGIRSQIVTAELLTPHDIEREFGMSGGHWHHVELALESFLFNRPVPALSRHTSPIAGLYLCGAGCHPGGNIMGIAGRNAAQQVLKGVQ
jgi:phytoene dehydrogenase-like protein